MKPSVCCVSQQSCLTPDFSIEGSGAWQRTKVTKDHSFIYQIHHSRDEDERQVPALLEARVSASTWKRSQALTGLQGICASAETK